MTWGKFSRFKWSSLGPVCNFHHALNKGLWCSQHLAKMCGLFYNSFSLAFCASVSRSTIYDRLPNVINYPADYTIYLQTLQQQIFPWPLMLHACCCCVCRFFIRAWALLFAFFNPFEMTRRWCCLISYLAFLEHNKEISTLVWQDASPSICWYFSLRIYSECRAATKFIHVTPRGSRARRCSLAQARITKRASHPHRMRYEK